MSNRPVNPDLPPPHNLVLELSGREGGCPMGCRHCLHRQMAPSPSPLLDAGEVQRLLVQGRDMGIAQLNVSLHDDDVSLPPHGLHPLLVLAHGLGYRVKTVTNGADPEGVRLMLPYLHRLAVSVDALDRETYARLREPALHPCLMATLEMLSRVRPRHPELLLTALVMVNRQTIDSVERRVAEIHALGIFQKIKLLEMLPVGGAQDMEDQALTDGADLERLGRLKVRYLGQVRVGTPLWRVEGAQRGCRLGWKDLVVGPDGQLAGCSLLLYSNHTVGNIRDFGSLGEAWRGAFELFRHRAQRPLGEECGACPFLEHDLCWGGCMARARIFGQGSELARSCGISSPEEAEQLYRKYEERYRGLPLAGKLPFPLVEDD